MKSQYKGLMRLGLFVLLLFALIEVAIVVTLRKTDVVAQVIDIQTPAALYVKLDYVRRFPGKQIVFLGDSVVYGRRMEEAGDQGWREHTISAHTLQLLKAMDPSRPVLAMNLAMNGALPADIEQVVKLLVPLKPDCIVTDISLRAFSADFSAPLNRYSRPWLAAIHIDTDFNLRVEPGAEYPFFERIDAALQGLAITYWHLYQVRDFVQWRLFNGEPSAMVRRFRDTVDQKVQNAPVKNADPLEDVLLTLKAKNRYDSVTLNSNNPQIAALIRTLDMLTANNQCAMFFYATEEKNQLADLVEASHYRALQAQLALLFSKYADRGVRYVAPLEGLGPELYLDYGHLNSQGNAIVASRIVDVGLGQSLGDKKKGP